VSDLEGDATDEHDEDLDTNFDKGDQNEIPVPKDALEDIELVVEPPAVDRVEDLGEDEGVKNESRHDQVALRRVIVTEDVVANEVEDEDDDDLIYRLAKDHLNHVSSEKARSVGIRLPVQ